MVPKNPDVLICGAGIAGIAAAYHLAVRHGMKNIWLVDERPPLTLTSDKSTEAYRNWWPGPDGAMVQMMNRSIDLLEEIADQTGNVIRLNQRGYLFTTADPLRVEAWRNAAQQAQAYGAGGLRIHNGYRDQVSYQPVQSHGYSLGVDGADLLLDHDLIRQHFGYLRPDTLGVLHVRRAGWLSAQQLGMYLLESSQSAGVRLVQDRITGIKKISERIDSVQLMRGGEVKVGVFVNAAGPFLKEIGQMMGVNLPVVTERHQKVSFQDSLGRVPRDAPLLIWSDQQSLDWTAEERMVLAESPDDRWLLEPFPSGVHARPDGEGDSQVVLMLWEYDTPVIEPRLPVPLDGLFAEVTMRGMAAMIPGLTPYFTRLPKPFVDGGYYTKTIENRPLACPLPVRNSYVVGALSGFGIMASLGMAELTAAHITGDKLPGYAPAFHLDRYTDPAYQALLEHWGDSWQL